MATASPRFKEREIPERMVTTPRGVEYCLARLETSSMDTCSGDAGVHLERPRSHTRGAVVLANSLRASLTKLLRERRVLPQGKNSLGQTGRVVRFHQNSATCLLEDLGKCSAPRLDNRDSVRHRLQQKDPLRFIVGAGDAQDIEVSEEIDLGQPVQCASIAELLFHSCVLHFALDGSQVLTMLGREIPGNLERGTGKLALAPQPDVRLSQQVQALFRRDPGEVSHRETVAAKTEVGTESVEVDAKRHHVHLLPGDAEVGAHELRVKFADRREAVHVPNVGANQLQ